MVTSSIRYKLQIIQNTTLGIAVGAQDTGTHTICITNTHTTRKRTPPTTLITYNTRMTTFHASTTLYNKHETHIHHHCYKHHTTQRTSHGNNTTEQPVIS